VTRSADGASNFLLQLDLVAQAAITVSGANFSATLAAQSVTTFVGSP
jgi:O-glycosyl hydrolase